jgi:uncharacterized protein
MTLGFVDSDSHVRETEKAWDYLDPSERHFRPKHVGDQWLVGDVIHTGPFEPDKTPEGYHELFPRGSGDLTDQGARLKRMDELGVDVHVLFSTWWLNAEVLDPVQEAAMARSWNRWMAEHTSDGGGRLVWTMQAPARMTQRAREEMEFAKEHGAVGVHMSGLKYGYGLADPINFPIYEIAQDLDLTIAVHLGGSIRKLTRQPHLALLYAVAPVLGAFHSVLKSKLPERYPGLRWAFVEAGASWLPFVVQEIFRTDDFSNYRNFIDWQGKGIDLLVNNRMYVTCQIDDDIPYLVDLVGGGNLVHGTDYAHLDLGSDRYGCKIVARKAGRELGNKIADTNGRELWGIDPSFRPAPEITDWSVPQLGVVENWVGSTPVKASAE